jgi:sugar phosphate isomerase/epimerase
MNNRREFLKQSTGLLGLSVLDFTAPAKPLLTFSTLGCPSWNFSQVVKYAAENKYAGIEIRGIKGDLDLPSNPLFSSSNITSTKREAVDANIKIVNLGSSANLHFLDPSKRQKNLDEAKNFTKLWR